MTGVAAYASPSRFRAQQIKSKSTHCSAGHPAQLSRGHVPGKLAAHNGAQQQPVQAIGAEHCTGGRALQVLAPAPAPSTDTGRAVQQISSR